MWEAAGQEGAAPLAAAAPPPCQQGLHLRLLPAPHLHAAAAAAAAALPAQGLALGYGGNPYGPAGTGKTESVKALGQALGRQVRLCWLAHKRCAAAGPPCSSARCCCCPTGTRQGPSSSGPLLPPSIPSPPAPHTAPQVLVFNCGEEFDFRSMGRIFVGLVRCGAWGCFDEFNRLEEEVLSALSTQIQAIQVRGWVLAREAGVAGSERLLQGAQRLLRRALHGALLHGQLLVRPRIDPRHPCWRAQGALKERSGSVCLLGRQVAVDANAGIFVTLNPAGKGYGGRSKLPDNLKQLFRCGGSGSRPPGVRRLPGTGTGTGPALAGLELLCCAPSNLNVAVCNARPAFPPCTHIQIGGHVCPRQRADRRGAAHL